MKILLIGGAGFVGHHLAIRLKQLGHEPVVADNLLVNNVCALMERQDEPWGAHYLDMLNERMELLHAAGIRFRFSDARDYHGLSRVFADVRPDCAVHLAAVAHIDRAKKDPWSTFDHSLRTLENAADASVATSCGHFVYFSSSTVYGNFPKPTVSEQDRCEPIGTYGSLKLAGELLVKAYHADKGLPYTIVRPQALYGRRCVSGRVTQAWIERALDGQPLVVHGDGSAAHDFTYIDDLVEGLVAVIEKREKSVNETFCLTAGEARTLQDLAEIIQSHIPCQITYGEPDPHKPSRGTMAFWKAKRLLGWQPQWSLEKGMASYIGYYKEKFDAARQRQVA